MASTSDTPSVSSKNRSLITEFCSVTGAIEEKATNMLEICDWNLEMAINMYVDSDYQGDNSNGKDDSSKIDIEEETVRPPIPPSREILVEDGYNMHYELRGSKRRPRTVFDGFRDIEAETQWQEMELGARAADSNSMKKHKTLEDLFRPPLDLMHRGSFETARESGKITNKWLMVNIQDSQEFSCQILNRDIWSNPVVKNIISEHFVFWQVLSNSVEGQRYTQFYNPVTFPYVAVIDPRTGENLKVWNKLDPTTFCDLVSSFLTEHAVPDGSLLVSKPKISTSLLDISEEQQMKAAMEASLKDVIHTIEDDDDNMSETETFESDSESQHANLDQLSSSKANHPQKKGDWKEFLGQKDDETTDLVLRLPDGKREKITWPCTSKIRGLILYAATLGYNETSYELITNFPRKNLGELPQDKTLKEMGLYPREMIFIQLKATST